MYKKGDTEMEFMYINDYTGELYTSLFHAIKTIISDMIHFPKCRTIKMFKIKKYTE